MLQGGTASGLAQRLMKLAFDASMDKSRVTPYSKARQQGGWTIGLCTGYLQAAREAPRALQEYEGHGAKATG